MFFGGRIEKFPFEGGKNGKAVQGDDPGPFLSEAISKFSRTIPLRPPEVSGQTFQRGNSFQQLLINTLVLFVFLLSFSNCTDSFQALQDNDQYFFSIYGFLDASADTQWVRISSAREQVETTTEIPEMTVSVENMDTGQTIVMNDSLFQQRGVNYLNFWTTEKIQHNQIYRLTAQLPDGKSSQVTVHVPEELPTPRVIRGENYGAPTSYTVMVDSTVTLVDIQTRWYVRVYTESYESRRMFSFSYRNSAETAETHGGIYTATFVPDYEFNEIERQVLLPRDGGIEVLNRQIFVAASGPEWNDEIPNLDDLTYALPESVSNVEKGVGYFLGISSKTIPYRSCQNENSTFIPCETEKPYW